MAKVYGTPLYVYDFEIIVNNIEKLRKAFSDKFDIFYSMKCNPNLGLLKRIKDNVNGIEVASAGELFLAINSGIKANKIIFVGPGKTDKELKYAIDLNILAIIAESFEELKIIDDLSRLSNKKTTVAIRINPKMELSGARIKMGGVARQFGIDEENIDSTMEFIKNMKNISLGGIHVYIGTQILQENTIIDNMKNIIRITNEIREKHGIELKFIDFGGGLGVPYFNGELPLNMNALKKGLDKIFQENKLNLNGMKLIIESGRYLVADAGTYLTKVLYKKVSRGKTFIITDGGSNNHSAAAGLGRFIRNNFPITKLNKSVKNSTQVVDIVGTLCTPTDVLASNIELPEIERGDILAIEKSGAYGLTASPIGFISHQNPAEILIDGSEHYIVRERGTMEDLLIGQAIELNKKK
ncbi:diaminopimelate decarboxylase [Clostridium tertium]|nr:diaminopimelate decarboxylase [Clostridium tertium]